MQIISRGVHVARPASDIESSEQPSQALGVGWLDARLGACFREELKAFVPVALDHSYSVYEHYTMGKRE
jgi:hypothetical protein